MNGFCPLGKKSGKAACCDDKNVLAHFPGKAFYHAFDQTDIAPVDTGAHRAYGFFLQTEDGSDPANRVVAQTNGARYPQLDYDPARLPVAASPNPVSEPQQVELAAPLARRLR